MVDEAPFELRRALGRFATGVTVVTTKAPDGTHCGMTVNSFNAVSLKPPLILWSIACDALAYPIFRVCPAFAVHVLGAHQRHLSVKFAARGTNKFAGIATQDGFGGVPCIPDALACFECSRHSAMRAGDHEILIGRVQKWRALEGDPLVFFRGSYLDASKVAS